MIVFDSHYGDGGRWSASGQERLHVIALAQGPIPGFRRLPQRAARLTIDLLTAPLAQALKELDARIDAVHLHELEADTEFVRPLVRLLAPDATLTSQGLNAAQVQALTAAGFVFAADGSARFSTRKPARARAAVSERRAIVVGAGLAGAAACERLSARGWEVTLVEQHAQAAQEASGNRAGIYMPLLSKDDNIPSRLTRAAYLFALDYWRQLDGIEGEACGVLQLARDAGHASVQQAVIERWNYPEQFVQWRDGEAAPPHGGWLFPQGGWARPASVCAAMLARCDKLTSHFGVGPVTLHRDDTWRVLAADGREISSAPVLVLANGIGAARLTQASMLPLTAVRGQVTHLDAALLPPLPMVLCREAYVTPASNGVCSAGATYDLDDNPDLSAASHEENLRKLRELLGDPALAVNAPLAGRVGFRCVAPDRLPLVGAMPAPAIEGRSERLRDIARQDGLYALLGYASRGLIWAPLAAELLAAQLEGEPLPVESTLAAALDPARFTLRLRHKNNAAQG